MDILVDVVEGKVSIAILKFDHPLPHILFAG